VRTRRKHGALKSTRSQRVGEPGLVSDHSPPPSPCASPISTVTGPARIVGPVSEHDRFQPAPITQPASAPADANPRDSSGDSPRTPQSGEPAHVSKHNGPLTPNLDEHSPRRLDTEPKPPELTLGIRHGADGSTVVQTNARGVPAILAHTHVWTVAIVVVGLVAMAVILVWIMRPQLPPMQHDTARDVGAMIHNGPALLPTDFGREVREAEVGLPTWCSATGRAR
jgi:hypothetical protein